MPSDQARVIIGWRVAAVAAAVLAAACGSSAPAGPSTTAAAVSSRSPITLKVMTFNIQHGLDANGRYNLQRAIDAIARIQPDVVGLQEVTRNHPAYGCEDQPERIASGLRAATRQSWTAAYEQEWFTPDTSCRSSGRGDGPETEGLVLLSRRLVSPQTSMPLSDSRIGLETTVTDAYGLPILVTHLTSGAAASTTRSTQIGRLMGWARGFGEPRIVVGDFNAAPQAAELQTLFASYHDAWVDASQTGRAVGSGNSHGAQRIDYVFFVAGGSLTLEAVEAVDTSVGGVQASDHQPVLATFTVR